MMCRSKDEAINAAVEKFRLLIGSGYETPFRCQSRPCENMILIGAYCFKYPQPVEIPPDMAPVWVKDHEYEPWQGPYLSTGITDDYGWIIVYFGKGKHAFEFFTGVEPEEWGRG